jgi:glutaconate CoA-transferase subunit A
VIRQGRRGLTIVRMTPDLIYDQLIGMGCADRLVFSWGGNPGVGSLHRLRDAVENGWPRPLAIEEHSHAAMGLRLRGGRRRPAFRRAARLSRRPAPGVNSEHPLYYLAPSRARCSAAVPSLRADVAIVHAQKADAEGNVLIEGIVGVQKEAVLGAKRSVVTVEAVVESFGPLSPNAVILPRWVVTALAVVPGGAHPSYAHGYYKRDNAFYQAWDAIARDRDSFKAWMQANVISSGPEVFREHAGKAA